MIAMSLDHLDTIPRWVAWKNETRNGRTTKVPYGPSSGAYARSDDPGTWGSREAADSLADRIVNGGGGGVGIMLGEIPGEGRALGGVDLDTCMEEGGILSPWAMEVIERFASYAEISPSRTGAKLFFTYDPADLPSLRVAMGSEWGKQFKRPGGDHPPAIELYLGNRYFAVTGERLDPSPALFHHVPMEVLLWLIREAGPAFTGRSPTTGKTPPGKASDGPDVADDLVARIHRKAALTPVLRRRWAGDWSGLADQSRSGMAMALGAVLRRAGFSYSEMTHGLRLHPATADWTAAKGEASGGRELRRIWEAAAPEGETAAPETTEPPSLAILTRVSEPAPDLPLDVFGSFWSPWITRAAEAANAPPDYVALPLLACASALIGNARWAQAWPGWEEPPVLWCANVGDPSSGKSSGAKPVNSDVLAIVERHMAKDYPDELKAWTQTSGIARAILKQWEKDVAKVTRSGGEFPKKPLEAEIPPKPIRPRASVSDVTVEKLGEIIQEQPKGVLYKRDELAGWLLNFARYSNGGTDRPFWLEAYVGGPHQVDRVKNPEPIFIPHLSASVFGTIQPDRLGDVLIGVDDGLTSRLLWAWPEANTFRQPDGAPDAHGAADALIRLANIAMLKDQWGYWRPSYTALDGAGRATLALPWHFQVGIRDAIWPDLSVW